MRYPPPPTFNPGRPLKKMTLHLSQSVIAQTKKLVEAGEAARANFFLSKTQFETAFASSGARRFDATLSDDTRA